MRIRTTFLLSALLLGSLVLGTAAAQPTLAPPGGPVPAAGPSDPYGPRGGFDRQRGPRGDQQQQERRRPRIPPAMRAALLARFDRNGDGRLTGRERMQAKRFVMRLRRERRQERRQQGGGFGQ